MKNGGTRTNGATWEPELIDYFYEEIREGLVFYFKPRRTLTPDQLVERVRSVVAAAADKAYQRGFRDGLASKNDKMFHAVKLRKSGKTLIQIRDALGYKNVNAITHLLKKAERLGITSKKEDVTTKG